MVQNFTTTTLIRLSEAISVAQLALRTFYLMKTTIMSISVWMLSTAKRRQLALVRCLVYFYDGVMEFCNRLLGYSIRTTQPLIRYVKVVRNSLQDAKFALYIWAKCGPFCRHWNPCWIPVRRFFFCMYQLDVSVITVIRMRRFNSCVLECLSKVGVCIETH